jgi:hypothetical protein
MTRLWSGSTTSSSCATAMNVGGIAASRGWWASVDGDASATSSAQPAARGGAAEQVLHHSLDLRCGRVGVGQGRKRGEHQVASS